MANSRRVAPVGGARDGVSGRLCKSGVVVQIFLTLVLRML